MATTWSVHTFDATKSCPIATLNEWTQLTKPTVPLTLDAAVADALRVQLEKSTPQQECRLYTKWFASPSERSVIANVCQRLLNAGIHQLSQEEFTKIWAETASALGRPKTKFLPHHFRTMARHRYGAKVTEYPPFVLTQKTLTLNPVVAKAVETLCANQCQTTLALHPVVRVGSVWI